MEYKYVSTGSYETEEELRIFLNNVKSLEDGVPRALFKNDYYWRVMTVGRNGSDDKYPGSQSSR